jgi:DNA-binding NarL/FixJ family response regulator
VDPVVESEFSPPVLRVADSSEREQHPAAPTRIVIADDSAAVRMLLRTIFSVELDLDVVGEAEDGLATLSVVDRLDGRVDLLVIDLGMPNLDGLETIARLRRTRPELRVVVYSGFTDPRLEQAARGFGVRDYVVKGVDPAELVRRIRVAAAR